MSLADITGFLDWLKSRQDGPRLAEVNSDLGSATGPEDYEFIRKTLPSYAINSPQVVQQAGSDIDKALANYKLTKTLEKTLADQAVAEKNIGEFGNLYPDWRQEVGPTAPISQFYSDYSGRIDPKVTALEPYQKAVSQYTGGISEGENRGITAQEHVSKLQGQANLAKYIANTEIKPGIKGWNSFVEGIYALPNVDMAEARAVLKEMEGRNSGPTGNMKKYSTQTGGTTSVHQVDTDMFGRPVANTGVTATHTPPQAAPMKPGELTDEQKLLYKTAEDAAKDYMNYSEGKGNATYDEQGNLTGFTQVEPDPKVLATKRQYANATRNAYEKSRGVKKANTKQRGNPTLAQAKQYIAKYGSKEAAMDAWNKGL